MKLLMFNDYRVGVLKDGHVHDVTDALNVNFDTRDRTLLGQARIQAAIEGFDGLRARFEEIVGRGQGQPYDQVKVLPPVHRPWNVLSAFGNYSDRGAAAREQPQDFFHKGTTSIIGHQGTVELPDIPEASVFQPEPEFAYVIGKEAKRVSEAEAMNHVFGYVNFFDISARDIPQRRTTLLPKELDTWAPMGPVIVTKDEIPDPQNVRVRCWWNGELTQDYNTEDMSNGVARQIAWLTQYLTLKPGDVISCGVHHKGLHWINDGDVVEMEIDGCERLRINVTSRSARKEYVWRPPGMAIPG